jgi:hypothetical protein
MATRYIIGTYTAPHQGQSGRRVDEFTMYSLGFIHPIAIVRWYSEAAEIARLLADSNKRPYAFMEVGGDQPQVIQPNLPADKIPEPSKPVTLSRSDFRFFDDPHDGVPADTGTV